MLVNLLTRRPLVRVVHLVAAVLLGTYLYSPLHGVGWALLTLQVVVVPVATITGLAMWQVARLRRMGRRGRAAASVS